MLDFQNPVPYSGDDLSRQEGQGSQARQSTDGLNAILQGRLCLFRFEEKGTRGACAFGTGRTGSILGPTDGTGLL